ncbi:MAG: hypothetical protein J0L56_14330 [Chitinophagales bacterium]|nr:hypothetical protein [Chitinophagales bacterium]
MLFSSAVCGQAEKVINIPTYKNYKNEIDTTLWFKWKYDLAKQINLKNLQTSTDTFHFRFWTDIQTVDIWTIDHNSYFGLVTNYAQRYDDKLLRKGIFKIGKIYSNQMTLDSTKARQLFNTINKLSIVGIPTDDKINGWHQGFDGEEFLIETSTPTQYDFKTYWTPRIFADTLKEAKQIQTFVDYLYSDFKIYNYYQKLKLPKGSYQRNGVQGIEIKAPNQKSNGAKKITDLL